MSSINLRVGTHTCKLRGTPAERFYTLIDVFFFFFLSHFYFPASGQAVVTGVVPFPRRFLPSIFIAHRVQQSHCSSLFPSSVANSRSRAFRKSIVRKKKSQRNYTSMQSAGLELTKLTYTTLEDNLMRHRGDRFWRYECATECLSYVAPRRTLKLFLSMR